MPPKRIPTATKNPCNQFLVTFLMKARNRNCSSSKDFKFFMYSKAIDSVRKYPLPIICEEQVRMLSGVGDFLVQKIVNAIKDHYRKFLKVEDHEIKENNSIANKKPEKQKKEKVYSLSQNCSDISEDDRQSILQERDLCPIPEWKSQNFDVLSVKSEKISIKSNNKYKPKPNSQAAILLRILSLLNATTRSFSKTQINQKLEQLHQDKIKQWKTTKQTLLKYQYIEIDPSTPYQSIFLTEKAVNYTQESQIKSAIRETKKKINDKIKEIKEKMELKNEELVQNSQNTQSISSKSRILYSNSLKMLNSTKSDEQPTNGEIFLMIDNREKREKDQEKNYFEEKITEKYKIKCLKDNISLGDFIWVYRDNQTEENFVLDYIIQRKKADDLASSILDGRYKEQKYRLKNSGISNIIYLYEGHASQTAVKTEKQLQNALMKTRVYQGFKVYKTKSINETAKLLATFTKQLQKKLLKDELQTLCTLKEFNKKFSKKNSLTLENMFGMGLKMFPNIGKSSIKSILKYYRTYKQLYEGLKQFKNNEQRYQFLCGLLKGGRTQMGSVRLVVEFMFQESCKQF